MTEQIEERTTKVCRCRECSHPVMPAQEEWGVCEIHYELSDVQSDLDEWLYTCSILEPWVEAAKVITPHLAEVMEHALSEAEQALEGVRERKAQLKAQL